jgi:ubiquinone/menaquinone biosynthesis C-methylase UbiE
MKILDVGCGNRASGTVNVDLYCGETMHRRHEPIDMKHIPNFVLADACHLPFKDNSFDLVRSDGLIEHLTNPILLLEEMIRVSKFQIIVKCPHRRGEQRVSRRSPVHLHHFNLTWFWNVSKILPILKPRIYVSEWNYFPHSFFPLIRLPMGITFEAYKSKN